MITLDLYCYSHRHNTFKVVLVHNSTNFISLLYPNIFSTLTSSSFILLCMNVGECIYYVYCAVYTEFQLR